MCPSCPWRTKNTTTPEQAVAAQVAVRASGPQPYTSSADRYAGTVCLPWLVTCGADLLAVHVVGLPARSAGRHRFGAALTAEACFRRWPRALLVLASGWRRHSEMHGASPLGEGIHGREFVVSGCEGGF
jgi:hypothetical protein